MFEEQQQWAVTIPGELRSTGSRSLVYRGEGISHPSPGSVWRTWRTQSPPAGKARARKTTKLELGGRCYLWQDSKKWAGGCRMEEHPADPSDSIMQWNTLSDFYTRSESYPCDFPSVALLWIVYFARTGCVASKSFLLLQRFARRGDSFLAADVFCSIRVTPWRSFFPNQSGALVVFIRNSKSRAVFCIVQ